MLPGLALYMTGMDLLIPKALAIAQQCLERLQQVDISRMSVVRVFIATSLRLLA